MNDIKAPAYAVPPAYDARGGDEDWVIGVMWGFILLLTALICACALLPIISFENRGWMSFYTAWRITPARIIVASLLYALAGAIQLGALRRWLPLSRWWIAALAGGQLAAVAISYQLDRAAAGAYVNRFSGKVMMQDDLPGGLGWLLAALAQALLLGRFSRRAWEWLVPPAAALALAWFGTDVMGAIAYLLLAPITLVRLLRAAPDQPIID